MELYDDILYWYKAKCHRVYDGDTFTQASTHLGLRHVHEKERFRLFGIRANEIRGSWRTPEYIERAEKAKYRLRELTKGTVLFRTYKASRSRSVDKYGKYGRWLCTVYVPIEEVLEIGSPIKNDIEYYENLHEISSEVIKVNIDSNLLVVNVCGHRLVNVNLLLIEEGLADIYY